MDGWIVSSLLTAVSFLVDHKIEILLLLQMLTVKMMIVCARVCVCERCRFVLALDLVVNL